jgi:hypothetical protein
VVPAHHRSEQDHQATSSRGLALHLLRTHLERRRHYGKSKSTHSLLASSPLFPADSPPFQIRSIFRIAEYAQGYDGQLRTTEWCLYVFDSLPLFVGMIVWVLVWPPAILNEDSPFKRASNYGLMDRQKSESTQGESV